MNTVCPMTRLSISISMLVSMLVYSVGGAFVLMANSTAWAQSSEQKILARANDEIVTEYDLNARSRLILESANIKVTQQSLAEIRSQALRQLIDERLQIAYAEKYDIIPTRAEITESLTIIAKRNNKGTVAQFEKSLRDTGIDPDTLRTQIRAKLAWRDYVVAMYREQVDVSDELIASEIAKFENQNAEKQIRLFEIFLPINDATEEKQAIDDIKSIERLLNQGAKFSSLARNFSKSNSASAGGDLGWLTLNQITPNIQKFVRDMGKNSYSQPIRLREGVLLLHVSDERQGESIPVPEYEDVRNKLFEKQMQTLSARGLRDLRKTALIEIRE